jgi:hypothetical protein
LWFIGVHAESEVSGGDVLPGFSFRPADLFHFDD